jgi:hypothetical protein
MVRRTLAFAIAALAALPAAALDTAEWPPPPETVRRMQELQHVIIDPASSVERRDAARHELSALLRSPAGQSQADVRPAHPARAAIEPFPSVVKPYDRVPTPPALPPAPQEGVARVEIVEPPKPIVIPQTGQVAVPSGNFVIDPQGRIYHPLPGGGYIDPRTGAIVPR